MPKKRVAISGKMTSGKTTGSNHLIERYGYKRISFAEPIKRIVEGWLQRYSKGMPYGHTSKTDTDYKVYMEHALYRILLDVFNQDYTKSSLATDILLEDIFPRYMDIDWSIEKNDKWRRCLQEVGGGRIRTEIDDNVWVNYQIRQLESDGLYICDDLRYQNEYRILEENGFTMIRLDVSPETQMERIKKLYGNIDPQRLLHPSEIDLDNVRFQYHLDGNQQLIWVLHDLVSIVEAEG